jgi:hypothetical protein
VDPWFPPRLKETLKGDVYGIYHIYIWYISYIWNISYIYIYTIFIYYIYIHILYTYILYIYTLYIWYIGLYRYTFKKKLYLLMLVEWWLIRLCFDAVVGQKDHPTI